MGSPLQLKSYFFPHVLVTADPSFTPNDDKSIHVDYKVKTGLERDEEHNLYQVAVEIVATPDENAKIPYSIHLVGVGLFTVDEKFPEPEKLLKITGASIIYSAAREFLITITSRGPWPAVILPMVSFLPREKME
jgi:preprotein translocase subunit SecB